ncbi:MAG: TOBE domain-containing protein, partial [Candidatus Aminicenantes bacterium]
VASFIGQVNVLDAFAQKGRVYIKGTSIEVETDTGGRVDDGDIVILIRPEDIEIASGPQTQFLPASIHRVHYRGSHYEIDCSVGMSSLRIIETKNRFLTSRLKKDMDVALKFKSCRVFNTGDGHARIRAQLKELGYIE